MHKGQAKEFSVGSNACRQNNQSSLPHVGRSTLRKTEELGGLEEGVGSEDGGDNLARGVDGAFAV